MRSWNFRELMAVALVLTTTFVTMPLTAADFSTVKPVLGSVSAVGSVDLRGVGISTEGTLFAGDSIRTHEKAYAKVLLGSDNKIEIAEKTDVSVNRDGQGVKIAMNAGIVGFTAKSPLRIDVLPFEISATDDTAGNIAIMSSTTASVRTLNGKVTVRNLKTSESFVVTKGQERLLGLKDGIHAPSIAELASNVPGPIPAPQTPAGRTAGKGLAMDTGAWLAVIAGGAIAGIAIWGLVEAKNNHDDTKNLQSSIDKLTGTITANQTANAQALANLARANAIANTAAQQQANLALVTALAAQAQLALLAAGGATNAAGAAQAAAIAGQASASAARLQTLQSQIQALQAQLAAGTGSQADLTLLLQREETERTNSNNLVNMLNTLLNTFRNTPGVPNTQVSGTPPPTSASIPV